jgi:hypothetical protein
MMRRRISETPDHFTPAIEPMPLSEAGHEVFNALTCRRPVSADGNIVLCS